MKLKVHIPWSYDDASAAELPRVYFSSHPNNTFYINEILGAMNKTCESAVWYPENQNEEWTEDELYEQMSEVDLIVVPITRQYLREPNRARDVEVPHALERHIPILFLLVEAGCEAEYAAMYGNIQYLSPHTSNKDGMTYEDKIEEYLKNVIAGTELRQRVHKAFDAHVFLSYRKKDRKHALKLMEQIHADEKLSSLAIWYDDFLVPGEDFNDTIFSTLKSSDLFVLAVTPNIYEPNNYVIREEYPSAIRTGRRVLPIEMLPTERESLFAAFPDLPEPTSAENEEKMHEAIIDALGDKISPTKSRSAEKNYLLGAAFFYGIEVERNFALAIRLLETAARGGSREAIGLLVWSYRYGKAVFTDNEKAVAWQRTLVELYREDYEREPSEETAYDYFSRMNTLGTLLMKANAAKESVNLLKRGISELTAAIGLYGDPSLSHLLIRFYCGIGDALAEEGEADLAKDYYLLALDSATDTHENKQECNFCARIAFSLGELLYKIEKKEESLGYYRMAVDYRQEHFSTEATASEWYDLRCCYDTLSQCANETVGMDEAIKILDVAERAFRDACDNDSVFTKRFCYFEILEMKAGIYAKNSEHTHSEEYYLRLIRELEESDLEIKTINEWMPICKAYHCVSDYYRSVGNREMTEKYLVDGFKKPMERILKAPLIDGSEFNFIFWNTFELAASNKYKPYLNAINELCRLGVEFCEIMIATRADPAYESYLSNGLMTWREIRTRLNDYDGARECLIRACRLSGGLLNDETDQIGWLNRATYLRMHSMGFEQIDDDNTAAALLELALHAMEQFVKDAPYLDREREILFNRSELARVYIEIEEYEKAEAQLLHIYRFLTEEEEQNDETMRRIIYYGGFLLELYRKWGRPERADRYLDDHKRILDYLLNRNTKGLRKLEVSSNTASVFDGYSHIVRHLLSVREFAEAKRYADMAMSYMNMQMANGAVAPIKEIEVYNDHGNACIESGDYADGRVSILRAADIQLNVLGKDGHHYSMRLLAIIYERMSELLHRAGEEKESVEYGRECMRILEKTSLESHDQHLYNTWLEYVDLIGERVGYKVNRQLLTEVRRMAYKLHTENPDNPKHKRLYELSLKINA